VAFSNTCALWAKFFRTAQPELPARQTLHRLPEQGIDWVQGITWDIMGVNGNTLPQRSKAAFTPARRRVDLFIGD
jgi:hypothetical protein